MKALLAGLLLLVGCHDDIEMFPVNPGGGGPTSGTGRLDAAIDGAGDGDGGDTIMGRVCVLTDARQPTVCAATGAEDITVTLGTSTAMTTADGSFTITNPGGSSVVWRVSGTQIVPSAMSFSTQNTIPAIDSDTFAEMLQSSAIAPIDGDAQIIARVRRGTTPLSNVTATTDPASDLLPQYDGNTPANWQGNATGAAGVIWVPGVLSTSAQLVVHEGASDLTPINGIPLFADTVTFVFADFP